MEEFTVPKSQEGEIVEERLGRICKQNGVKAVVVLNGDDLPIHSTVDSTMTMALANSCRPIERLSRSTVRDIDPTNDLVLIRMRTHKSEIMIVPEEENLLVVLQNIDKNEPQPT